MGQKQKILLTGGTGFLGSNLLRKFISLDLDVFVLLREKSSFYRINDLVGRFTPIHPNTPEFNDLFLKQNIHSIIHCATNYGRGNESPVDILEANLILPLKLLQIGADSGVKCFINTDTVLDKRVNHYSLSKKHFKDWLQTYSDKMVCLNVALEHFYGPHDNSSKFTTWIIQSLIRNVDKIDLTLGEQKRDFIHIDDVVEAFVCVWMDSLKHNTGFFHYEIGTGRLVSISDFVKMIKKLVGNDSTTLNFGARQYRENEVMASSVDLSNIRRLGWMPTVSLEDGLKRTVELEKRNAK